MVTEDIGEVVIMGVVAIEVVIIITGNKYRSVIIDYVPPFVFIGRLLFSLMN